MDTRENERASRINFEMNGLHDMVNAMYEQNVDREFVELKATGLQIIKRIREIVDSTEDRP